jgi:hypothetical protein
LHLAFRLKEQIETNTKTAKELYEYFSELMMMMTLIVTISIIYNEYENLVRRLKIENEKYKLVRMAMSKVAQLGEIYELLITDF